MNNYSCTMTPLTLETNDTTEESHSSPYAINAAQILMIVAIVTTNTLTLVAIATTPRLQTIANTYIASLAVSDLLVSVNKAVGIFWVHPQFRVAFEESTALCMFFKCLVVMTELSSLFTIILIALDRFLCIKYPFLYLRAVTKAKVKLFILLAWVLSATFTLIVRMAAQGGYPGCGAHALLYGSDETGYIHGALFLLICTALFILYGVVLKIATQQAKMIKNSQRIGFIASGSCLQNGVTMTTTSSPPTGGVGVAAIGTSDKMSSATTLSGSNNVTTITTLSTTTTMSVTIPSSSISSLTSPSVSENTSMMPPKVSEVPSSNCVSSTVYAVSESEKATPAKNHNSSNNSGNTVNTANATIAQTNGSITPVLSGYDSTGMTLATSLESPAVTLTSNTTPIVSPAVTSTTTLTPDKTVAEANCNSSAVTLTSQTTPLMWTEVTMATNLTPAVNLTVNSNADSDVSSKTTDTWNSNTDVIVCSKATGTVNSNSEFTVSSKTTGTGVPVVLKETVRSVSVESTSLRRKDDRSKKARKKLRAVKLMAGVFVMLFVCWSPYAVVGLIGPLKVSSGVVLMTAFLASFNSAANFGVYALGDRTFRAAIVRLVCCRDKSQLTRSGSWNNTAELNQSVIMGRRDTLMP